jgi:hypothetical protein
VADPTTNGGAAAALISLVDGTVTATVGLAQQLNGRGSVGAGISVSPIKYTFVRTGLSLQLTDSFIELKKPVVLGLSWGLGYDDWHSGTFSLQANNWGPSPIDDPASWVKSIAFDAGYKVPFDAAVETFLAMGFKLSFSLPKSPSVGATITVTPWRGSFVSVGLRCGPLDLDKFSWSYTFGYQFQTQIPVRISYANWGPNTGLNPNFIKNGVVSIAATLPIR